MASSVHTMICLSPLTSTHFWIDTEMPLGLFPRSYYAVNSDFITILFQALDPPHLVGIGHWANHPTSLSLTLLSPNLSYLPKRGKKEIHKLFTNYRMEYITVALCSHIRLSSLQADPIMQPRGIQLLE